MFGKHRKIEFGCNFAGAVFWNLVNKLAKPQCVQIFNVSVACRVENKLRDAPLWEIYLSNDTVFTRISRIYDGTYNVCVIRYTDILPACSTCIRILDSRYKLTARIVPYFAIHTIDHSHSDALHDIIRAACELRLPLSARIVRERRSAARFTKVSVTTNSPIAISASYRVALLAELSRHTRHCLTCKLSPNGIFERRVYRRSGNTVSIAHRAPLFIACRTF